VWKVFAPRYMLGAVELICVDVAVLVGLWLGVGRIVSRITRVFALPLVISRTEVSGASRPSQSTVRTTRSSLDRVLFGGEK